MSTVSVIIPTWNRAGTLKRAILSVLNQTYPVTEILVCDDGSDDNSEQAVAEINDARVKWIKGERAGRPAIPRNRGIAESKGEWLAFLDSDDEWLPGKIEVQLFHASKQNTSATCSNAYRVLPENHSAIPYLNYPKALISFDQLLKTNYIICSSSLIKRSLIDRVIGFPESAELKAVEDYAFWLRVATQTNFAYVNEPLVNYNDDPKQSIRANNITEAQQRKIIFKNLLDWMNSESSINSEYTELARQEYYKSMKISGSGILSYFIQRFRG